MSHPADCPLTPHELAAVRLLGEGLTYKQIATQLGRSASTIRTHLHNAYQKLGVVDRAQAVIAAQRHGWIEGLPQVTHELTVLRNIERLLGDAIEAIKERNQQDGITQAQREYLREFGNYLRAPSAPVQSEAAERMAKRLVFVLREAGMSTAPRSARSRPYAPSNGGPAHNNGNGHSNPSNLTQRQAMIYDMLKQMQEPASRSQLANRLGVRGQTVSNDLRTLRDVGAVMMVGHGKGARWCVEAAG